MYLVSYFKINWICIHIKSLHNTSISHFFYYTGSDVFSSVLNKRIVTYYFECSVLTILHEIN